MTPLIRRLISQQKSSLLAVFLVVLLIRVILAIVSHLILLSKTDSAFLFPDDLMYHLIGWQLADYWHGWGAPVSDADSYLLTNYTALVGVFYYLFGPQVLLVKVLNAVLGAVCALVTFWLAERYFDRRVALIAMAVVALWPSLVMWSVLNLKDTFCLLLALLVLLGAERFRSTPCWRYAALIVVPLALLQNVRNYLFLGLALLIAGVLLGQAAITQKHIPAHVGLVAIVFVLTAFSSNGPFGLNYLNPTLLVSMENNRKWMAVGANTALVEEPEEVTRLRRQALLAPQVHAEVLTSGQFYEVQQNGGLQLVSGGDTSQAVAVEEGRTLVVAGPGGSRPMAGTDSSSVVVRPGQLVAVSVPLTSEPAGPEPQLEARAVGESALEALTEPAPVGNPVAPGLERSTPLEPSASAVEPQLEARAVGEPALEALTEPAPVGNPVAPGLERATPAEISGVGTVPPESFPVSVTVVSAPEDASVLAADDKLSIQLRTLAYLPRGLVYALLAPFPWNSDSTSQRLAVPEMVLWYAVVVLAGVGLWTARARWFQLLIPVAYVGGVVLLYALVDGNSGTLFRHRAMVTAIVLIFAAGGAMELRQRWLTRYMVARRAEGAS